MQSPDFQGTWNDVTIHVAILSAPSIFAAMRFGNESSTCRRARQQASVLVPALMLLGSFSQPAMAQNAATPTQNGLPGTRWVGIVSDVPTVGLWLEFFSDSMMILETGNAAARTYALDYRATKDSIIAWGDTTLVASYEFVLGRMLLYTDQGAVITMAEQERLARSFVGLWTGYLDTADGEPALANLRISANGTASWRFRRGGETHRGEWDRTVRTFIFTWEPDSTEWIGYHDPEGNALQFATTGEGTSGAIFRKAYR